MTTASKSAGLKIIKLSLTLQICRLEKDLMSNNLPSTHQEGRVWLWRKARFYNSNRFLIKTARLSSQSWILILGISWALQTKERTQRLLSSRLIFLQTGNASLHLKLWKTPISTTNRSSLKAWKFGRKKLLTQSMCWNSSCTLHADQSGLRAILSSLTMISFCLLQVKR